MKQSNKTRILVGFLAMLMPAAVPAAGRKIETGAKPNIVVILGDDLGCGDTSLYGGWIRTPNLDRMARGGMKFTDFHSNSSVCSPTRVAFLTGRYQQRLDIVDVIVGNNAAEKGIPSTTPTIPRVFKNHGYATAIFGKWHCGFQDEYNPVHHGFDEFVGFLNGGSDYHLHGAWRVGLQQQDVPGYTTHIINRNSVDFIRRNKDKPFFLYVAHAAVHNPYQTPTDTSETRQGGRNVNQVNDENRTRYRVMLGELDKGVGQILDTIEALGLAENTFVFFFSDNGDVHMSPQERPFRGGKFSQYEGGHRVPAVAWWPGKIAAGSVSRDMVVAFDLFPTLLDLAGLSGHAPDNLDGTSLKEHLLDGERVPERCIFFGYEPKLGTAMRRGNWKIIVKEGHVELYNLKDDIKEARNVADQHPDIVNNMLKAIDRFKQNVIPGS